MTTTIKYIIFFVLFAAMISQFLPVITELPFGIEPLLISALAGFRALIEYVPFLQTPWELFQFTIQLLFYYLMFKIVMLFITRGKSGSDI